MSLSPRRRKTTKPGAHAPVKQDTQPVTQQRLRSILVESKVLERAASGDLETRVLSSHPPDPLFDLPPDAKSQIVGYFNKFGKKIAVIHRYIDSQGRLLASRKEDPKAVFHKGILYYLEGQSSGG